MNEKKRVVVSSVVAAFCLTFLKLAAGLWTGSLGLLSDAAHSGLDLLAAVTTWFSVKISDKPADTSHPYGHQKVDNIAALFETLFLATTAVWILYEAIARLFFKTVVVTVNPVSFVVIVVCISVDFFRWTALSRAAKKTGSAALEANAFHFFSDIGTSLVVLIGLAGTAAGYPQADAVCSLGIAAFIITIACKLGSKAFDALTDRVPDDHIDEIRRTVLAVPGVSDVYDVRVRHAGNRHFIDLKTSVDGSTPIGSAHAVSDAIENAVASAFSNADVVVHMEPREGLSGGLTEMIFGLARDRGINVHSLNIHQTDQGLYCTMHLEWPGDITLGEAHRRATEIEERIKRDFPEIAFIRSHLECCGVEVAAAGEDVTAACPDLLDSIHHTADAVDGILHLHDIRIMEIGSKRHISLVCAVRKDLLLRDAHRIATDFESRIALLSPGIVSVQVHTEPA